MPATRLHRQNKSILNESDFARYIQQQLLAQAGVRTLEGSGLQLTLRIHGAPVRVDLAPFFHDYQGAPAQLDSILGRLIRSVQSYTPDHLVTNFAVLSTHIYPMLKPVELLLALREANLPMLPYQLFLADLMITYVIDQQDSVSYINELHMQHWQVDIASLHEQAIANLRQRSARIDPTRLGTAAHPLFLFNSQDGYDATRLLLPELLQPWRAELPGQMVLGIPHRDFLIALSDHDPATLTSVAQQIQLDKEQHTAGLTDQLFTLVDGQVQEYTWR